MQRVQDRRFAQDLCRGLLPSLFLPSSRVSPSLRADSSLQIEAEWLSFFALLHIAEQRAKLYDKINLFDWAFSPDRETAAVGVRIGLMRLFFVFLSAYRALGRKTDLCCWR